MPCASCGYQLRFSDAACPRCKAAPDTPQQQAPSAAGDTLSGAAKWSAAPASGAVWGSGAAAATRGGRTSGLRAKAGLALLAVLLLCGGGYYRWTQTPVYALWQACGAAQRHDLTTFERYVDIDGVVNTYVGEAFNDAAAGGPDFANGLMLSFQPVVSSALQDALRDYVVQGDTGLTANTEQSAFSAAAFLRRIEQHQIQYRDIAYVQQNGDAAHVGIAFQSASGADYVADLEMRRRPQHWRIVRFTNALVLWKQLMALPGAAAPGTASSGAGRPLSASAAETEHERLIRNTLRRCEKLARDLDRGVQRFEASGNLADLRQTFTAGEYELNSIIYACDTARTPPRLQPAHNLVREGLNQFRATCRQLGDFISTGQRSSLDRARESLAAAQPALEQGLALEQQLLSSPPAPGAVSP